MSYVVRAEQVEAQTIAAARARMAGHDIPSGFKAHLDKVWEFLGRRPDLRAAGGHNVFVYSHDMDSAGAMTVDFGVQVSRPFEPDGDVFCAVTPAGRAATTIHVGPYAGLRFAHGAVHEWMKETGCSDAGWSWEIYGDWNDDPEKLETQIFYLLR